MEHPKEIRLPSGRTAQVRKGFGRDLMRAHRVAGHNAEPSSITFALIAELVQVDGQAIVFEDVLAMELADVLRLEAEVAGGLEQAENF
ncbi:MAG: hypothetical protein ABSG46_00460 [Candidatus Binataceae bacterium]|jgi:hypothetical protein